MTAEVGDGGNDDGGDDAQQKLAALEAEIARLRHQFDTRLSAIADELRRAEARDEWAASHLRDVRRDVRGQGALIEAIHAAVTRDED